MSPLLLAPLLLLVLTAGPAFGQNVNSLREYNDPFGIRGRGPESANAVFEEP